MGSRSVFSEPDKEPRPTTSSDHFCALAFQMAGFVHARPLSCEFWGYFTDALFLHRPGRECGSGKLKLKLKKVRSQGSNSMAFQVANIYIHTDFVEAKKLLNFKSLK